MTNFCDICGQPLVVSKSKPRFDRETGAPLRNECPSGTCGHYGVEHKLTVIHRKHFWNNSRVQCSQCKFFYWTDSC